MSINSSISTVAYEPAGSINFIAADPSLFSTLKFEKGAKIVIESPQVTKIEMQGTTSFQIAGDVKEMERPVDHEQKVAIEEDDIDMVASQTGVSNRDVIREALEASNGDIAKAILNLKEGK